MVLRREAAGERTGTLTLRVNSRNPTVTTGSADFVAAADGAAGWEGQVWDKTLTVPLTTLDALIAAHGLPAFVKIDVEGLEDAVLAGLSVPVPALSFEFTTIGRDVARRAMARLVALGFARFNVALGETQVLVFDAPIDAAAMLAYLEALPQSANSGDVYAFAERRGETP